MKDMLSEVQKNRVNTGLEFQSHITESFADLGLENGQHITVESEKYTSNFNVDSHVPILDWENNDGSISSVHLLGEIKKSLKADAIYKVMAIADTFKEENPDKKYVIFYKDGGIEDTKGSHSDFKKLKNYPTIDAVIPESSIREWFKNPKSDFISSKKPIDEAVDKALNRLITYDPAVTKYITDGVIDSINEVDKIKIIEAPTGFGKTYFGVNTLLPYLEANFDVELVIIIAPQVSLLNQKDLLPEKENGCQDFQFQNGEGWGTWREARSMLKCGKKVMLAISDAGFSDKVYRDVKKTIEKLSLKDKVLIIRDEAHYAGSSELETTAKNLGNTPSVYSAAMFTRCSGLLKVTPWVYYLTATPLAEQIEEDFGTNIYIKINEYPPKELLMMRTAKPNTPIFLPEARDIPQAGERLNNFIERIFGAEEELKSFVSQKAISFHPIELEKKFNGLIKLETAYPGKFKFDKDTIVEVFEKCGNRRKFNFIISTSDQKKKDGYRTFNYDMGDIKVIENDYEIEQDVYDALADKSDLLRFYVVVNKGSMGVNIPSLKGLLSFRTPKSEFQGEPVTIMGEQLLGRLVRLQHKVEDLYDHFTNKDDFIQYYSMVNSFDMVVEDFPYWRKAIEEFTSKLGSKSEMIRHLYKEL
jgi:hypothetical protein